MFFGSSCQPLLARKMDMELSLALSSVLLNHSLGLLRRQLLVETKKSFLSKQQQRFQIQFLELRLGSVVQKDSTLSPDYPTPQA